MCVFWPSHLSPQSKNTHGCHGEHGFVFFTDFFDLFYWFMRFIYPINLCDDSTDFEQARFLLKALMCLWRLRQNPSASPCNEITESKNIREKTNPCHQRNPCVFLTLTPIAIGDVCSVCSVLTFPTLWKSANCALGLLLASHELWIIWVVLSSGTLDLLSPIPNS